MSLKKTTEEFVAEARRVHGNRYNYSKVEYRAVKVKVRIICPEHGEFWQTPEKHLQGRACPKCNPLGKFQTGIRFIERAREIHGDRYDYSKVEYDGAFKNVAIICPKHGEFKQRPGHHLDGHGCPKCAKEFNAERSRNKQTREEAFKLFLKRSQRIHGNRYDYSKVEYVNAISKVCIICPEHGEFWQVAKVHSDGGGCPQCNKLSKAYKSSVFPSEAAKVHGDRYDYSKIVYKGNSVKVCIVCPEHGEFWQTPYEHLKGAICPKCSKFHGGFTLESFITKAREVHGDRYDYSRAKYKNAIFKVEIICKEHGSFWQVASQHLAGAGCPVCGYSHGERKMSKWLVEHNIDFVPQQSFPGLAGVRGCPLRFDFYLPKYRLCIEVDGPQHYEWIPGMMTKEAFLDLQEHDRRKAVYCAAHGLQLLRIRISDLDGFLG